MERHLYWKPHDELGMEHLRFSSTEEGFLADGLILRLEDNKPFRLHYQVICDTRWRVRYVEARLLDGTHPAIILKADGKGHWTDINKRSIADLDDCLDVDISATPYTNTLPIRRLTLKPKESAVIQVAYITAPEMLIQRDPQRYTCLEANSTGGVYKYESLKTAFTANLPVDADGLVLDYPGLFVRVWPRQEVRAVR